jgi:DNA-binding SARP family transcriptional activator/ABC-type oligopeptide transport system substrate-binding subunit/DNA-binding beta-propeller fold protein YncE
VQIRVLGDLELVQDDRRVPLGSHQQRAVLAMLVLHAGEVVGAERLIDGLWEEAPPPTAAKTLQVYISRLRKALASGEAGPDPNGSIVTRDHGYALRVDPEAIDLAVFQRLLEAGREAHGRRDFEGAAALLREALALWRGPPLAEFAEEPFARDEVARLEELHLEALEARIDADLALGRHGTLVGELQLLTAQHPFREQLRAQRMLALYRSDRQPEALEVYRATRRLLVDELGLEPSRALRELHEQILRQDPALTAPAVGTKAAPSAVADDGPHRLRRRVAALAAACALVGGVTAAILVIAHTTGSATADSVPGNSVAVLDTGDGRLLADVPVGVRPGPIAVAAGSVWVANLDDGTVTRIDAVTRRLIATKAPGGAVTGLAATRRAVWVADTTAGRARRIDPGVGGAVTESVPLVGRRDGPPQSRDVQEPVAVGAGSLWFAHDGVVTQLSGDGRRRLATIPVGNEPTAIAVDTHGTWVTDDWDNNVTQIVAGSVVGRRFTGQGPDGIAIGAGALWVAQRYEGNVARIDPDSGQTIKRIGVGAEPRAVAIVGHFVWVASSGDGTVTKIDTRSDRVARIVHLGGSPVALAVVGHQLWVSVQSSAAAVSAAGPGSSGGVAHVDFTDRPDSLDPGLAYYPPSWMILDATCAKLYSYPDASGAQGSRLIAEVARGLPAVSADRLRYTFTIRPGFRFSPPSNAPVTAGSFRHALERSAAPKWENGTSPNLPGFYFADIVGAAAYRAGNTDHIAGITASGDKLTIRLTHPSGDLPLRLSLPFFCAVPTDTPLHAISNLPMAGPYYIKSVIPDRQVVLARNPNYRGRRHARLDAIDIRIGRPPATAIARVTSGADDYYASTAAITAVQREQLQQRFGASRGPAAQRFFVNKSPFIGYFLLNTTRPLFARARLRRAIGFAINRKALTAQQGIFGPGIPTDQDIAPGTPGFRDEPIYPLNGPNIAHARRLGGQGRHRRANLLICNVTPCPQWAAIVKQNLSKIGIDVTAHELPFSAMFKREANPEASWDLAFFGWTPDLPDPSSFLNTLLRGHRPPLPGNYDFSHFNDPVYNRRLDAAALLSGPERYATYAKLDRDLTGKAAPIVPFFLGESQDFFSARMGCQIYRPASVSGIDLAALCIKPK